MVEHAQNEIYFNSLVASGLLLHIEDPALRESIEAVYTTKKRRVTVNEGLLRDNSEKVFAWVFAWVEPGCSRIALSR